MRLAFYTYSYTDRLNLSVPECFAKIARTGYSGIDESSTFGEAINSDSVSAERRKLIRDVAAKEKLRVEAIVTHAELTATIAKQAPLDLEASIDLAAALGGEVVTFHLGGSQPDWSDKHLWEEVVEVVRKAARYGDGKHVSVAIDVGPWPTWLVKSPDDLERLFDDVGSTTFGVNFDPSYLLLCGINPVSFVERFATRIRHVHLKDHVGKYPRWEHRIPGRGELDYIPIVRALSDAKYGGALAIECFTDMPFEEASTIGWEAVSRAFELAKVELAR